MCNYKLKSIGNVEVKEFILEGHGYKVIGLLGKGNHFNWLSLPQLCVCVELADWDDDFWNSEQLALQIEDPALVQMLIAAINKLANDFLKDECNCFNGKNFITTREYTFWLECECESLSRQLIELELRLYDSISADDELEQSRQEYYLYSREQYGTDAF